MEIQRIIDGAIEVVFILGLAGMLIGSICGLSDRRREFAGRLGFGMAGIIALIMAALAWLGPEFWGLTQN